MSVYFFRSAVESERDVTWSLEAWTHGSKKKNTKDQCVEERNGVVEEEDSRANGRRRWCSVYLRAKEHRENDKVTK